MKTFRYILAGLVLCACFAYASGFWGAEKQNNLPPVTKDGFVMFSQEFCGHCHTAKAFIDQKIRPAYPDLVIQDFDIASPENFELMKAYARAYHLDARRLGTPLIFVGEEMLLGWGSGASQKLEKAVAVLVKASETPQPVVEVAAVEAEPAMPVIDAGPDVVTEEAALVP